MHPPKEEKNSWVFATLVWGPSVQWWDPLAAGECDVGPLLCPLCLGFGFGLAWLVREFSNSVLKSCAS